MRALALNPAAVAGATRHYAHVRARLLAEVPDLDAETLADTLEGISDLSEMLGEIIRSALDDEALGFRLGGAPI